MALPLPKVVSDVGPGGPVVTSQRGMNALAKEAAEAQYAPWTQYADASSKIAYANMLPYQMQATVLSNPMLWMALKDNPGALNALVKNLGQSVPSPNQLQGSMNMPPMPGTGGNNLMSMAANALRGLGIGGQQQPPMGMPMPGGQPSMQPGMQQPQGMAPQGQQPQTGNAMVPGAQGGIGGALGKMTAPYMQSPFDAGKTVATDEGIISAPTGQQTEAAQQAIQGVKNLTPILKDISKGAERWLAPGQKGKIGLGQVMNYLQQNYGSLGGIPEAVMKQFGVTSKDITEYAEWQAQQQKAVETMMKSRQWPNDELALKKVSKIIEPVYGEGKEYGDRVTRELAQLQQELVPNYQQTLRGGFQLNNPQQQSASPTTQALMNSPEAINEGLANVNLGDSGQAVVQATKTIEGKNYVKINGKWYPQ